MKFTSEVTINKPIVRVIELISDVNNLKEWQPELQSFETFSGTQGMEGAKSKLIVKAGGRRMEMIETIIKRDIPHEYSATYDAKGVHNIVRNLFEKIDENTTKYTSENEFQFTTPFMKIIGILIPGVFKKNCDQIINNFKKFAESRD